MTLFCEHYTKVVYTNRIDYYYLGWPKTVHVHKIVGVAVTARAVSEG